MKPAVRRVVVASLAFLGAFCAANPSSGAEPAAPPARVSWWIEGRPWNCADPIAPVARQVELACDASGGHCRVARSRDESDRVAALTCAADDGAWRLDAEDRAGRVLWSVTLTGDTDARARRAALWIARAEDSGPPAAESEPAPPAASPPAPGTTGPAAAGAAEAPSAETAPEAPPPAPAPPREPPEPSVAAHPEKTFRRVWLGLTASYDFFAVPGVTDVCKLDPSGQFPATPGNPYRCADSVTAAPYPGANSGGAAANGSIAAHGDAVQSGLASGNRRLLVSIDYALTPNLLVGARAGYSVPEPPGFLRASRLGVFHLEGRVTYLFGDDAISRTFAPMVLAAVGLGDFDARVPVPVFSNGAGATTESTEDAWITAGPAFVAAGGGLRVLLFDALAATVAVKLETAFGGTAGALFGAAPELGIQVGF